MTVLCETVVGDMRDDRLADGSTCRMARQRPGRQSVPVRMGAPAVL